MSAAVYLCTKQFLSFMGAKTLNKVKNFLSVILEMKEKMRRKE